MSSRIKPAPLSQNAQIGDYRVVRPIASGGFGIVYLAQNALGQEVAIKEYLPATLSERLPGESVPRVAKDKLAMYRLGLKSFFEEGRTLAQISHPSVVSVLNFFRANDTVYMVMNFLRGASLQEYIGLAYGQRLRKVLRESTIRALFAEVLCGLRIVHQHKVLHLDIKPANIFVTDDDRAVLIDFGAARQVLSQQVCFQRPIYTPGFAAPEMYQRENNFGPWTDIYAIGACIFACMTGQPPAEVANRRDIDQLAVALSRLRGVYSDNLLELVLWATALEPLQRPQSVFAFHKALSQEPRRTYTPLNETEKLRLQQQSQKNVRSKMQDAVRAMNS